MARHTDIEDLFLGFLDSLRLANGGPFKTLETFNKPSWEDALKHIANAQSPACLVISRGMKPSPLRPGLNYDQAFSVVLVIASTNLRGEEAARRGAAGDPGIHDLLDNTNTALLGKEPAGGQYGLINPGAEKRIASNKNTVVWTQEWEVIRYA